jgi:tetratricopeptide (TPR) repeat protein
MLLVEQRRFGEAEQIMQSIQPRLCDPSPALGRLVWIHRQEGKRYEALEELASTVRAFPWYQWGWSLLIDWLVEDQAWKQAHELLDTIPAELRTVPQFRRQRLVALERAGLPVKELDAEWSQLLRDFPDELPLHLHRYDLLRDAKRIPESQAVLHDVTPLNPDDPYHLARLVEVYSEEMKVEDAIGAMQRIFFAETESSPWPAQYAWEALKKAQYSDKAYQEACGSLRNQRRPTPTAFSILCAFALEQAKTEKVIPQSRWASWFPSRGVKELLRLLDLADGSPWITGVYRSKALDKLSSLGHYRLVVAYWKKNKKEVEIDVTTWSETGRALASLKWKKETRKLLSSWRQRRGVGMWVVANYVDCLSRLFPNDLKEVVESCGDALRDLPHDHCARYLAHVRAEANALLGDKQGLRETWDRYRGYFDCKENSKDWFQEGSRHLQADIPMLVRFLEQNQTGLYRRTVWGLRWGKISRSLGGYMPIKRSVSMPWWTWWILFWLVIQLLRLLTNDAT